MVNENNLRQIARGHGSENEFLSWFAGFWEGEGWFDLNTKKSNVRIAIAQTDSKPIKLIQSKLGGYVWCRKPRNLNQKPLWIWRISNRKAVIEIVKKMIPFLRFKTPEVQKKLGEIEELDKNSVLYSKDEDDFIKENWREKIDREIANTLNRSEASIRVRRSKLGLSHRQWSLSRKRVSGGMSGEMTQINLKLPKGLLEKIDERVKQKGYSLRQEFIRELLRNNFMEMKK